MHDPDRELSGDFQGSRTISVPGGLSRDGSGPVFPLLTEGDID